MRCHVLRSAVSTAKNAAFALLMLVAHARSAVASDFQALYSFCALKQCADGAGPYANPLLIAPSGTLYGTTSLGGSSGWGTVFAMIPDAKKASGYRHKLLYNFCSAGGNCDDGGYPATGVVRDAAGNLYGTTVNGGGHLKGEVFRV